MTRTIARLNHLHSQKLNARKQSLDLFWQQFFLVGVNQHPVVNSLGGEITVEPCCPEALIKATHRYHSLNEPAPTGAHPTVEEDEFRVVLVARYGVPDRRSAHRRLSERKATWQSAAPM